MLEYFERTQPNPTTELNYSNAFEILVAVILSAQCTDKRVNMVTPGLFAAYPTPELMAKASTSDLLQHIKSVSYPTSKALHLQQMSVMLVEKFGVDGNYLIAIGVGVSKKSSEPDFNEKVEFFRK